MLNEEYLKNSNTHSLNNIVDKINYYIVYMIEDPIKQYISSYKIDKATNDITKQDLILRKRIDKLLLVARKRKANYAS